MSVIIDIYRFFRYNRHKEVSICILLWLQMSLIPKPYKNVLTLSLIHIFRDDYDRFYSLFVKDVRDGRLGRYSLDRVGEIDAND